MSAPTSSQTISPKDRALRVAAAVAAAVWGAVLVAAYATERAATDDFASLASGLARPGASLAYDATEAPGIAFALGRAAYALGVAVGVAFACYGYGRAIERLAVPPTSLGRWETRAARLALGSGLASFVFFAAGHLHLLYPATGVVFLLVGVGLAFLGRSAETLDDLSREVWLPLARRGPGAHALLAVVLLFALCAVLLALAPPTARDALQYHLAAPRAYVAANDLVELHTNVHAYNAFGAEMLFLWALLLGSDAAAQLVHVLFGVACAFVVFAQARRAAGSVRTGLLAALVFASVPSVVSNAALAHNEMFLCLFLTLAVVAIVRWYETGETGALVWFAINYGLALGVKHTPLALAPVFLVVIALRARRAGKRDEVRTLLAGLLALSLAPLGAIHWYAQNWSRTRNPLYPFFWDLFPTHSLAWDAERARLYDTYLRGAYGEPLWLATALRLPWDVSVRAADDVNRLFDGVVGPAFLLLAPLALLALGCASSRARVVAGFVVLFVAAWASQSRQIRFLVPVLPIVSVAVAVALARLAAASPRWDAARRALLVALAGVVALNLVAVAASFLRANPLPVVAGLESRDAYLSRRLGYYDFYRDINSRLPADARVFLVDTRNDTYWLDRASYSDSFVEHETLGRIVAGSPDAAGVRRGLETLRVTHVLAREEILYDARYTPFDAAGRARWQRTLDEYARPLATGNGYALYELRPAPPALAP